MQNFITNANEKSLADRLNVLISHSEDMKFLVGYFYLSAIPYVYRAFRNLYENGQLRKSHIKILVGLSVDKGIYGLYEINKEDNSHKKLKDLFLESMKISFTDETFDHEEVEEQVKFFLGLLKEGYIELRKTIKPNHSKLYLFKLKNQITPKAFITGSSNLTKYGLETQEEFNVEIKDYGFDDAEEYFDNLWNTSIEITYPDIEETITKHTMFREITPYEAYAYILKSYLDLHMDSKISKDNIKELLEKLGYKAYSYQIDAVMQGLSTLEDHGGIILADVVGLGKTVVACMIAKLLNKRGIVIAPPHLIGQTEYDGWKGYINSFGLYDWKVFSSGKLEEALSYVKNYGSDVVIVDEAHRFRNEDTISYETLKNITALKKVMLLTATPFNNSPSDIFALIKLFTIPKQSSITFDGDIEKKFRDFETRFENLSYIKRYLNSSDDDKRKKAKKLYEEIFKETNVKNVNEELTKIAKRMKAVISPVVIRRNRLDLKAYDEDIELSEVKDPIHVFYELNKDQSLFYDEVIKSFYSPEEGGKFNGAMYMPENYLKNKHDNEDQHFIQVSQKNLYSFMKRLLVKRFESSFMSFYKTS